MYCDSATYDRANNSFIAYHNIKINENDSLELYGDSLHYFGDDQMAYIYGNVFVKTSKISLKSPSLIYDQARKIAFYNQGAIINDKNKKRPKPMQWKDCKYLTNRIRPKIIMIRMSN